MKFVVGGASTQSRSTRPGKPFAVAWASGACEYTSDMRQILSWPLGQYGPLLGFPSLFNPHTRELVERLTGAMNRGAASIGSYPPDSEEVLAEMLVKRYSRYLTDDEAGVRFFSNGTDACQCAVALARFATQREPIISIGYHGGSSPVFNFPPQNGGVISANGTAAANVDFDKYLDWRLTGLDKTKYAAVIVEVPPVKDETAALDVLLAIEEDCARHGMYFIADEIVTGFRYGAAGALEFYSGMNHEDIHADFVCLGKTLSTYGKVSALLGPRLEMSALRDRVFASYTFNDHPLGFIDAVETLKKYDALGDELARHLANIGCGLQLSLSRVFCERGFEVDVIGHPSRTVLLSQMQPDIYQIFLAKMIDEHNVLLHRPQFTCMAHTGEHVEQTVLAAEKVLEEMGFGVQ